MALINFFRHNELVVICNILISCLLRPINNVDNLDDDDANACSLTWNHARNPNQSINQIEFFQFSSFQTLTFFCAALLHNNSMMVSIFGTLACVAKLYGSNFVHTIIIGGVFFFLLLIPLSNCRSGECLTVVFEARYSYAILLGYLIYINYIDFIGHIVRWVGHIEKKKLKPIIFI